MELHLSIIGIFLVLLAVTHTVFPKYFKWEAELRLVSHINRQMMYVHTLFIALTVFLMGVLCLTSSAELVTTVLGKRISLGLGLFWFTRLLIQFFGYSSLLWRGKSFETAVHLLFSSLWTYFSAIFLSIYFF